MRTTLIIVFTVFGILCLISALVNFGYYHFKGKHETDLLNAVWSLSMSNLTEIIVRNMARRKKQTNDEKIRNYYNKPPDS